MSLVCGFTTNQTLFNVSNTTVTNKTQGVSSNLFELGWKLSYFDPRASSTFGNFSTFLALDFPQLVDALGKRLKFQVSVKQDLKELLNGLLDLFFYWVTITSIFRSSNTSFLLWM